MDCPRGLLIPALGVDIREGGIGGWFSIEEGDCSTIKLDGITVGMGGIPTEDDIGFAGDGL